MKDTASVVQLWGTYVGHGKCRSAEQRFLSPEVNLNSNLVLRGIHKSQGGSTDTCFPEDDSGLKTGCCAYRPVQSRDSNHLEGSCLEPGKLAAELRMCLCAAASLLEAFGLLGCIEPQESF